MVSREVLNPNYGLFKYMAQSNYQMEINPASKLILDDHLRYFQVFSLCYSIDISLSFLGDS